MCNALGIITYNGLNVYVQGLQEYRPIAGFNFLGRYRLVDFPISNPGFHQGKSSPYDRAYWRWSSIQYQFKTW